LSTKTQKILQFILENVEDHPADITITVASEFGISRQAAHRHVARLVSDSLLVAEGTTRDRRYRPGLLVDFALELPVEKLEEDSVWRMHVLPLLNELPANVLNICQYGFTEMVNNVIDHSEGSRLYIYVKQTYRLLQIAVHDNGIGIFNKIKQVFSLEDSLHAILELSKGKLTSDPDRHSGEGIFFSSRMFDQFYIISDHLSYAHIGEDDFLLENKQDFVQGTIIKMQIDPKSERAMEQIFDAYTSEEDYSFSKTIVPVFLAAFGDENLLSRSQAKRLLTRFEKFREIRLDFTGVDSIGQAFADEIFRVYSNQHPEIKIMPVNANAQINKMISHVLNSNI
jgi:anti-sigma regulatory factor (Ser/Thr protein kinase)